ncbi:MAG: hypothetical protein JWN64_778, partial [Parcubacteria group bacterium]|nr:hypothetical protein [Parcubacteria group bacterium]
MQDTEIFLLRGEAHNPWHLYVGVILCNKEKKVAIVQDNDGTYVLPRETVSSEDNLVRLVHRLILERVGVVPHVDQYLGLHVMPFDRFDGTKIEKTVLYFKAHFESVYHEKFSEGIKDERLRWVS